jgi:hypothetical protein
MVDNVEFGESPPNYERGGVVQPPDNDLLLPLGEHLIRQQALRRADLVWCGRSRRHR